MVQHIDTTNSTAATVTLPALGSGHPDAEPVTSGKLQSAAGQALPVPVPERKPDVEKIVQKLNSVSLSVARDLRFQVDLQSGKSIIQVFDSETGEMIRQIPAEKVSSYVQSGGNLAIRLFDELA